MNTRWHTQHRPVLAKVIADYDLGVTIVDPAAYATALRMTQDDIDASLGVLRDARFVEADDIVGTGQLRITRICLRAGAMFDEIVLRATSAAR